MSIYEATNTQPLKQLLNEIDMRITALPDFQRDFVWDPKATSKLIVSIAENHPAGSLLRVRDTKKSFAHRSFKNAPQLNGHNPTYLYLDGQQRLTSLYQAFYGVGDNRYYIDLVKVLAGSELGDAITFYKATDKKVAHFSQLSVQASELVLPLSVLKDGLGGYSTWLAAVVMSASSATEQIDLMKKLTAVQNPLIQNLDGYSFPVVTLSDETTAEAICTIFETLNSTGIKLGVFELLTARFLPKGVNLRDLLAKAKVSYPIIDKKDFDIDPYYLLQAISLASKTSPSCKRGEVLDLRADEIEKWWQPVVEGMARALKLLKQCGVLTPKWMPYDTALPTMAAVLAKNPIQNIPADAAIRPMLTQWFWCAVFGQVYQNSPNTQAAKDTTQLLAWFNGGGVPETVSAFTFNSASLRETTPRQRAVYRGVIALLLSRKPLDFFQGSPIDEAAVQSKNVDDHHIFPQDYLKNNGVPEATLRDCVLNRTLIDRTTNIKISNRAPSIYLSEIKTGWKNDILYHNLLTSHLLPTGENSPLLTDNFAGFLDRRQKAIWDKIQQVTGQSTSSTP